VRISDRLDDIDQWRKVLEYTIQDIDREIQAIESAKEQCERYLEHMRGPLGNVFSRPAPSVDREEERVFRCGTGESRDTQRTESNRQR
jgi:hypothetical protein